MYKGLTWLLGVCLPLAGQFGVAPAPSAGAPVRPPVLTSPSMETGFQGSVPATGAAGAPIDLSLADAIQRGLKYNLGALTSVQTSNTVRAQRLSVLSGLLPNITGSYSQSYERINLAANGFRFSLPPSSPFQIPSIVTFGTMTAEANLSQSVLNLQKLRNLRSADASVRAAQLTVDDSRDLVVQSVGNAYLLIIADMARIDSVKAQVDTSQVLFQRASDQHAAGTAPAIDQLRAEVQLRSDEQSSLAAKNQFEKDKLSLARVIGLPPGQEFHVTDLLPFTPLQSMGVEETLRQAYANRADMKAVEQQVRAAELARGAAVAEYYPTMEVSADFGDAGVNLGSSHNIFGVTGSLNFSIFSGGRIKSDIEQADAALQQRRNELADLRGQIDQQVRTALLDLQSSADQVAVAQRNVQLAHETLTQSRDRFTAGVTDNLEVVQAQQSVISADANLINSTYQHNLAKIELARSVGLTEQNLNRFIGGKRN